MHLFKHFIEEFFTYWLVDEADLSAWTHRQMILISPWHLGQVRGFVS
jgi:hypothetical protein